jgi:hypothetical protein
VLASSPQQNSSSSSPQTRSADSTHGRRSMSISSRKNALASPQARSADKAELLLRAVRQLRDALDGDSQALPASAGVQGTRQCSQGRLPRSAAGPPPSAAGSEAYALEAADEVLLASPTKGLCGEGVREVVCV